MHKRKLIYQKINRNPTDKLLSDDAFKLLEKVRLF
jgi:hypothetical protein